MRTLTILAAIALLSATYLSAGTLQDAYDNCGSGNGYDKYLELTPHQTYTGGLTVVSGDSSCIIGNYAKVDVIGNVWIEANGYNTVLDIEHLIIFGCSMKAGIQYTGGAEGLVNFCTVCDNNHGIFSLNNSDLTVKNSIVANNNNMGIGWYEDYPAYIAYCDVWGNPDGNYKDYCDGWGGGWENASPIPGTGCISEDPLFTDPGNNDYTLQSNSPCIGAAEGGADMGAIPYGTGIRSVSLGRIKASF